MFGDRLFERHLDDDEEVTMIVHKHWILGVRSLYWPIVSALGTLLLVYVIPFRVVVYMSALGSVACVVWGLRNFYDYYLDAWIITDQGIIDVEWHGWFHRQSTRVLYSDIHGVSYEIMGVLGTVMRYGTISVEKVSTGSELSLENVKKPREVEREILKNMEKYLHGKNLTDAKHVQELLSQIVAREVNLEQFEEDEDDDDDEYDDDDE